MGGAVIVSLVRRRAVLAAFIVFLLGLALLKFWPAFAQEHVSVGFHGDGWGTIAWIYDIHDNVARRGLSVLLSEFYVSDSIGGGLNSPGNPTNILWKTYNWLAGCFFAADDVYDLTGFLAFLLVGLGGFWLGRSFHLSPVFSAGAAFLLVSFEHFDGRLSGHLSFTCYYPSLLTLGCAVRAMRTPRPIWYTCTALGTWYSFAVNEYYGFFTVFVAGALVLASLILNRTHLFSSRVATWRSARVVLGAAALFIGLMAATYPSLFLRDASSSVSGRGYDHGEREMRHFTVNDPWKVFKSHTAALKLITPKVVQEAGPSADFSNRAGFLGVLCFLVLLLLWLYRWRRQAIFDRELMVCWLALFLIALVGCLLAAKPDNWWSLSQITLAIAPMFRSGIRALIFPQIAAVLAVMLVVQVLYQETFERIVRFKPLMVGLFCLIASGLYLTQLSELRIGLGVWQPFRTNTIPQHEHNIVMQSFPRGMVLNLPFYYPKHFPPESDYPYFLDRVTHGHPIFNGVNYKQHRPALDRAGMLYQINELTPRHIEIFRAAGFRYLKTRSGTRFDFSKLDDFDGVTHLVSAQNQKIFRIEGAQPYNPEPITEAFFYQAPYVYGARFFHPRSERQLMRNDTLKVDEIVASYLPNVKKEQFLLFKTKIFLQAGHHCFDFYVRGPSQETTLELNVFVENHAAEKRKLVEPRALSQQESRPQRLCYDLPADEDVEPRIFMRASGTYYVQKVVVYPHTKAH